MARQRSSLRVEGGDDLHAILHLLIRNGIDYGQQQWPSWFPLIEEVKGGKTGVLDNVERLVRASSNGRIGFVLDADDSVRDTWRAMMSRLRQVGLDPDRDVRKAVLHAWLAWQQEPGLPYGTAIRAQFLRHDSPAAENFVAWFRRVFEGG